MNTPRNLTATITATALTLLFSTQALAFFGWGSRYEEIRAEDGVVSIPASDFEDGKARYFSYKAGGKEIRFFVMKSVDGVIRAAFDACDVCYDERKGYDQAGEVMVCNNCGQAFHSTMINEVKGGCNPAPLARETAGGRVRIRAADIERGSRYF